MKMRWWLAIGLAAVMVSGVAASVAQLVITRKTQGVLPMGQEPTPASPRGLILAEAPAEVVKVAVVDRPTEAVKSDPGPADSPMPPAAPAEPAPTAVEVSAALPPPAFDPPQAEPMPGGAPVAEAPPVAEVAPADAPPPSAPVDRQVDTVAAPAPPAPASTDPVDTVESFVERNRKEAEEAIRTLSAESENLKKRLTKVETALARWQSFSAALNNEVRVDGPPVARSQAPGRWGRSAELEPTAAPTPAQPQRGSNPPSPAPADPSTLPEASTPAPVDAGPTPAGQAKPADIPLPTEPEPTPTPTPASAPPPQAEPAAIPPTPGADTGPALPSIEPAPSPTPSGAPPELPPPADAPPALPGLR